MSGLPDFRDGWTSGGVPQDTSPETRGDQTEEELARNGRNSKGRSQIKLTCPKCGDTWGNLPQHLPSCDGGGEDSE